MAFPLRPARAALAAVVLACLAAPPAAAQSPPTPSSVWNNFVGGTTTWSAGANWTPAGQPASTIDQVLGFGNSTLQTANGYTSTYNLGAFELNSLVFNSAGSSLTPLVLTSGGAGDTLRFNTSTTGALPSLWQTGTGRVAVNNGTALAGITLNNATTLRVLGDGFGELQINTLIAETGGSSGLLINQTGAAPLNTGSIVRLAGAGSSFSGGVTLTSGNLLLSNANSAGALTLATGAAATAVTALGTGTFTVNGGSLQFDPAAGTSGTGPVSGTFSVGNAVQLNSTLTLTGTNTAAAAPVGSIVGVFTGAISGTGGITLAPTSGVVNYSFTGTSTFTGPVTVRPVGNSVSTLFLGSPTNSGGRFTGVTSFTVGANSSLILNNAFGPQTRLNTTTAPALTLDRGNVALWGTPNAPVAETFGTLTVTGTASVAAHTASTLLQTATLTFGGLTRPGGTGTIAFTGTNLGSGTGAGEAIVRFTNDPGGAVGGGGGPGTTTISILAYAYADSNTAVVGQGLTNTFAFNGTTGAAPVLGLVRWDAGTQRITPLNPTTEYAGNLFLARDTAPTANHRYASTATAPNTSGVAGLVNPTTVNALVLDTNTSVANRIGVSLDGPGTLTVAGGAILAGINGATALPSNPSLINLGGLSFGSVTGFVHTVANLSINSPIGGSGGVVKSGFGVLALNGTNTFTGGLTVNSGTLLFNSDANLGAAGQPITLNGGLTGGLTFQPTNLFGPATATAAAVSRPITVGPSGANVSVTFANANLTFGGTISGSGQILKAGAGVLTLTGTNTFTGGIVAVQGTVAAASDAALGDPAAPLLLAGGTFQPTASFTSNRPVLLTVGTPIAFVNGVNWTVGGNITSQTNAATLVKDGTGDLILTGANTFTGGFQIGVTGPAVRGTATATAPHAGRVILSGPNGAMALAAQAVAVAGGEIVLDNAATANNNRLGTVTVGLTGGNLTLVGNASAPVNEAVGAITINSATNPYGGTLTLSTPAGSGQSTTLTSLSFATGVGTLFVRGTNLGAATGDRTAVVFGANPAQVNGLIPSMVGATSATSEPTDFLTTQTFAVPAPNSNQFALVPFAAYTAGTGALGAGNSAATYDVTAAATFAGASAANALRVRGGSADLGGGTLALTTGAVLATGGVNGGVTNGTLGFGANVARLTVAAGSDLTLGTGLTGTGGFVKTGGGVLTLNTPSSITGTYAVGGGTLRYGVANALPTTTALFLNSGATLDLAGNSSTLANIQGYGTVNLGTGSLTLDSTATTAVTFGSVLTGSGALIKQNTSTVTLSADSPSFTGGVRILGGGPNPGSPTAADGTSGGLVVNSPGALGTGTSAILLGDTAGAVRAVLTLGTTVSAFSRDIAVQAGSTPAVPHALFVGANTMTISSNVALGQLLRLNNFNNNTGSATLTGTVSGAGGLEIFFGSWGLWGNNTYQGGTTIDTGPTAAIGVGSDTAFGTGPVAFTAVGGNLRADNGPRTLANPVTLLPGAYFGVAGTNNLTLTGPVDLSGSTGPQAFVVQGTATTTLGGGITNGTGGITKNGPGVLVLTGNNTYSGATTVNAGTLIVNNTAGSGTGNGNVVVNAGAILGGSGTVGTGGFQPVTINTGGVVRPGASLTGIDTLTVNTTGTVSFAAGSTLQVNVGSSPTAGGRLAVTGGGTIDLTGLSPTTPMNVYLTGVGGLELGTPYSLTILDSGATPIAFPGGFDPTLFSVTADFAVTGLTVLNPTAGTVVLSFTPVPEPGSVLLVVAGVAAAGGLRRRVRPA